MPALVEFDLGNNTKLRLEEIVPTSLGGVPDKPGKVMRGKVRDVMTEATQTFEEAIAQVGPAAVTIVEKLQAAAPTEIELEFGLKLEAKAGAIITLAGGEAHFKVALKWKAKP